MSNRRPKLSHQDVQNILSECYGLQAVAVKELDSFDSRNFLVKAKHIRNICIDLKYAERNNILKKPEERMLLLESPSKGSQEKNSECLEYVLKILNRRLCSPEHILTIQEQFRCVEYLRNKTFLCPEVVYTERGGLLAEIDQLSSGEGSHAILLTYLHGHQLGTDSSSLTDEVLFELGILLANLHLALHDYNAEHLQVDPHNPWALENMHLLTSYTHCIQDVCKKQRLHEIVIKFGEIQSGETFSYLQKGIIHGDFHDYNIIINNNSVTHTKARIQPENPFPPPATLELPPVVLPKQARIMRKYGIIDFEDMSSSYLALEISRLISDMMIDCHEVNLLDIGGHILAGYISVNAEPVKQFNYFYESILASLAQYIILGTYEYYLQGEDNAYTAFGSDGAWDVIQKLEGVDAGTIYKKWSGIISLYGHCSPWS